jgi:hypothetical protein
MEGNIGPDTNHYLAACKKPNPAFHLIPPLDKEVLSVFLIG